MSYVNTKGSFGKTKEVPPSYAPSRCRASFPSEVSGTKPSAVFDPDLVLNTADVVPKERVVFILSMHHNFKDACLTFI